MDFNLPPELIDYLARHCAFIAAKTTPLQAQDDNERPFDHRRRYRITEGCQEIQTRKVAGFLFGCMGPNKFA